MKFRFVVVLLLTFSFNCFSHGQVGRSVSGERAAEVSLDGDPVDLGTGLYYRTYRDLVIEDTIPIEFTRTQRNMDHKVRAFGLGSMTSYDMWIIGDADTWTWVAVVMADGSQERFERSNPGRTMADAIFVDSQTPTVFHDAQITWAGDHWLLKLVNGTEYSLQACNQQSRPGQCAVTEIRNASNDVLRIDRDTRGNITKITSPHGHVVRVLTDADGKIIHVGDDLGHWLVYSYDSLGELIKAMNWRGEVQRFSYDGAMNLSDVHETGPAQGSKPAYDFSLHNDYDLLGRTTHQALSDGHFYDFSYVSGEHARNLSATVTDNFGTTTTKFERGRASEVAFKGKPMGWTIDFVREATTGATLGATLHCANGRTGHIPSEVVNKITRAGGDAERDIFANLCTRTAPK